SKCCDYVVSLNKVINFSEEERLPETPTGQLEKVSALVKGREKEVSTKDIASSLAGVIQSMKEFFNLSWIAQPIPVAVRSGALALLVLLMVSTSFFYSRKSTPLNLQMEVMGKTGVVTTRGIPEETVEKIIKEGDMLFSNDYCRINFEIDQDAYAYVLFHDSIGKLHQLYPDPAKKTPQKVKGKTKHTIPEGENSWFRLNDTVGTETVFVLASKKPISDLKETFDSIQSLNKEEVLELLKTKANVLKALNFKHQ
ncbi:MAG: DUF4384 domain-containing protein, partial [Deltaproteobacteria bacterium]|nr:DUF4384 domain-containing protein [Deltaproteobacteria bacterium]